MTLPEWQAKYSRMRQICERIDAYRRERACRIGQAVGLSDGKRLDMCCVHNASISSVGEGWGAGPNGRAIIRTARAMKRILGDFSHDEIVRSWDRRVRGTVQM